MSEITNNDLMLAIKEMAGKLNNLDARVESLETKIDHLDARVESLETKVDHLDNRVANLESEQKIMREEMNQNFRKLDKKISIFADDLIDVRSDMKLVEEKIG